MEEVKCEQVSMLSGGKWDKLHDISCRVYSPDGLVPTVHTMGGGQQELKIIVPEATKKGHDTATYGDNINMAYPNSKARRGRVGHGVAQTLTTGDSQQVIVEPIIYDDYNGRIRADQDCIGTLTTNCGNDALRNGVKILEPVIVDEIYNNREPRVYSEHCPTIRAERQGLEVIEPQYIGCAVHPLSKKLEFEGYKDTECPTLLATDYKCPKTVAFKIHNPRIAAMRGRNPDNPNDRTAGSLTEQRLEIGNKETSNTLTTVQKNNLVVEPNYRFFEQAFETLRENECEVRDTVDAFNKRVNKDGLSPTITTRPDGFKTAILPITQEYRIRKLTPDECFRLQGVKEEDFERVAKNQSMSSRYHLAGDSIVTTCLMAIFGKLLSVDYQTKIKELVEELKQ